MSVREIVKQLKNEIEKFDAPIESTEYGVVQSVSDGVCRISGLAGCQMSEMLTWADGTTGLALNLEQDTVGAIVLGDFLSIKEGDKVTRTGEVLSIPVSNEVLGRVVDPLMRPLDGKGEIKGGEARSIEQVDRSAVARSPNT